MKLQPDGRVRLASVRLAAQQAGAALEIRRLAVPVGGAIFHHQVQHPKRAGDWWWLAEKRWSKDVQIKNLDGLKIFGSERYTVFFTVKPTEMFGRKTTGDITKKYVWFMEKNTEWNTYL